MYMSDTYVWSPDGQVRKLSPPSADGLFRPGLFGYGWLYGISLKDGVSRYEPRTGTWQHLTDAGHKAQFPGTGAGDAQVSGEDELSVFVGREVLRLGETPLRNRYAFEITAVSADAHVVAGYGLNRPFIWRCR